MVAAAILYLAKKRSFINIDADTLLPPTAPSADCPINQVDYERLSQISLLLIFT
jgi:hypothetical protein